MALGGSKGMKATLVVPAGVHLFCTFAGWLVVFLNSLLECGESCCPCFSDFSVSLPLHVFGGVNGRCMCLGSNQKGV